MSMSITTKTKSLMPKIMCLATAILLLTTGKAQNTVASYSWKQYTLTYAALTTGTQVLGASVDDGSSTVINFPFTFMYHNVPFTTAYACSNGHLSMGYSTNGAISPIQANVIAPFGGDGATSNGGKIWYDVQGTAPYREVVIEFNNMRPYFSSTYDANRFTYQIRLEETTNIIRVAYISYVGGYPTNYSSTRMAGLIGATTTDFNNRVTTGTASWTTSTAGTANSSTQVFSTINASPGMPNAGLVYEWYYAVPCTNSINTPTISTAATPDNTLCLHGGETVNFMADFASGPPLLGVNYQWMESSSPGGPFTPVSGGTSGAFGAYQTDGLGANPVYYMLEATCISEAVTVNSNIFSVFPNPTVALVSAPVINTNASPIVVCSNETYTVTASGAFTYTWTNGPNSLINNVYVVNPANGYPEYGVEAESIDGCFGETAFSLQIKDAPIVTAVAFTNNVCQGGNVTLFTFGNAVTYTWSANANSSNAPVIVVTPAQSGLYVVSATAANGCMTSSSQSITVHTPANITATTPKPNGICAGETVNLTAQGAVTYTWNSNSGIFAGSSIEVSPEITTNYMITATDANGCISLGNIQQKVDACVGITELGAVSDELSVYPNPANSQITVELNNGAEKTVELFDLTGRVVLSGTTNNDKINLNIESLQNGVYFVKVKSNNTVEVIKIVKQ